MGKWDINGEKKKTESPFNAPNGMENMKREKKLRITRCKQ